MSQKQKPMIAEEEEEKVEVSLNDEKCNECLQIFPIDELFYYPNPYFSNPPELKECLNC